jgi:hypothetical protein
MSRSALWNMLNPTEPIDSLACLKELHENNEALKKELSYVKNELNLLYKKNSDLEFRLALIESYFESKALITVLM